MSRRVILIILAGVGLLCVCSIGVAAFFLVFTTSDVPTDVAVTIDSSRAVPLNEPYLVRINVENLTAETQTIDSIDIQHTYLEGVRLIEATPNYTDSFDLIIIDYQSYTFETPIQGNETIVIDFVFEGETEGTFAGDIDICINSGTDCLTRQLVIEVGDATGR